LTREAREALLQHDWPGNVRELRNALDYNQNTLLRARTVSFPAGDPPSTDPNPDSDSEKFPDARERGDGHG
jgi:transcriptional regulator with PAS, ATPase and Fis domain